MTSQPGDDTPRRPRHAESTRAAAARPDALARRARRRRTRRRIAGSAAAAYLLFLVLNFCGCTDRLVLFPSTNPLSVAGTQRLAIPLDDGGMLEIWTARSRGAAATGRADAFVLVFTGNAARAELTAEFFSQDWGDRPVEVWAVNYPGYGGSSGRARLASIPPAALAAYDALRAHAGDAPILVEARSIGTTAALYVAANRPVAGCLLHNPPPLRSLLLRRYGWWNLWLLGGPMAMTLPEELDGERTAPTVRAPAVFVLAGADAVVPPGYQERVVRAYAGETRVVRLPAADHTARATGAALAEYEAAMDWLLPPPPSPPGTAR